MGTNKGDSQAGQGPEKRGGPKENCRYRRNLIAKKFLGKSQRTAGPAKYWEKEEVQPERTSSKKNETCACQLESAVFVGTSLILISQDLKRDISLHYPSRGPPKKPNLARGAVFDLYRNNGENLKGSGIRGKRC